MNPTVHVAVARIFIIVLHVSVSMLLNGSVF